MKRSVLTALLAFAIALPALADWHPVFSTAGFFKVEGAGREVYSMNPSWLFCKGHAEGADAPEFNDSAWEKVSLPHGIENLPMEASGCVNYQGEVWYRKHFAGNGAWKGQRLVLYFEAIMGKCKIWVNGKLVKEHTGGFLPVIAEIGDVVKYGQDNVIAVMADNSDDPSYPPGKPQYGLDFTYSGGIYRDCWLVTTGRVFITDANQENEVAGGGVFVSYGKVSESLAEVNIKTAFRNSSQSQFKGTVTSRLVDKDGKVVWKSDRKVSLADGQMQSLLSKASLRNPNLWSPDDPYLYRLYTYIKDAHGKIVDGYYIRIGIRSLEFKAEEGFWLNGKPFGEPLIGANRHQDYAVVGNALSNSLHWRDAKKLRSAGMRVIRNAHYPQDPAFMDACDELGLFVIENTPGWQFWNTEPSFAEHVYSDIRNIIRRDRNRPSVWLYEPILNETGYPEEFALKVKQTVEEEYPYPYCYTASDATATGSNYYDILFGHPLTGDSTYCLQKLLPGKTYFTREWGDNVDNWDSHNSPGRASRAWGEIPMLIQAKGYARTDYKYTCIDALYRTTRQHVGGCLWHSFDHQRGYHPDPFYGGIMDNYRQKKYSYYMFCSQRPKYKNDKLIAESGPMVYIANEMTPFSPADITVFSNCDSVRLTCNKGKNGSKVYTYTKEKHREGIPSPVITFKDVFHVMDDKWISYENAKDGLSLLAEGFVDGKLAATHQVKPARRPTKIRLSVDSEGTPLYADGSDLVTVVAEITDDEGNVKHLNNEKIVFTIEGEGRIIGDAKSFTNPVDVKWGSAPVIIQSTTKPGTIRIRASVCWKGKHTPADGYIEIQSQASPYPMVE